MSSIAKVAVPHAVLLISDVAGGEPPAKMRGGLIASTRSCVAVGCLSDANGATEVTLGRADEVQSREKPVFDDEVETPNRVLAVWTVARQKIFQTSVVGPSTRIRIWVNDASEPDKVDIGWG
jgi:hypothetical protein